MRSRASRSWLVAGAAAAAIAVTAGLDAWAVSASSSGAARPAAAGPARHQPGQAGSRPTSPGPLPTSAAPGPQPTAAPPPSPTPLVSPVSGLAGRFTAGLRIGAFTGGQALDSFDAQVGGRAVLSVSYVRIGTPVHWLAHVIAAAAAAGAEPVLELYPGPLGHDAPQVAAGAGGSAAWLAGFGHAIAATGDPVAISFFPEMNGPWRAWWSQGAANYIRAYRHVHQVLASLAGRLITWFWQPSAMHNANPDPVPWWPGRGYVDMVALDGYYYFPHDTFDTIFGTTIALVRRVAPTVPMMVGETAAGPEFGRQAWEIGDLFAGISSHGLLGLVWFNRNQHYPPYQFHQDWRLQDHPAALAAFRACLHRYPLARLLVSS